jgi:hypothetical protein
MAQDLETETSIEEAAHSLDTGEAHQKGQHKPGAGWHGDSQGHALAGRKGGEAVSRDRTHMAEIGRRGGEASGGHRRAAHQ